MSSRVTDEVKALANDWEKIFRSAKCSGILPDRDHLRRGGYHVSREDQVSRDNYSIVRPDDKLGPADAAAAIDMTMNDADMRACTERLIKVYANPKDPRRKYINAFNGWLGSGSAQRWDVYARKVKPASSDHKWHVHLEIRRRFLTSPTAMKAILSALRGETLASYLGSMPGAQLLSGAVRVPPFPGTLRRDDRAATPNPNVKMLQVQLLRLGLTSIGHADGYFGAKMEAGVKALQKRKGLTPDGVVGAKTWPAAWTS